MWERLSETTLCSALKKHSCAATTERKNMEKQELNINEIVVIEQLPQLFYKLEKVGEYLDKEMSMIHSLILELDSKSEIKAKGNDPLEEEITMNSLKRW